MVRVSSSPGTVGILVGRPSATATSYPEVYVRGVAARFYGSRNAAGGRWSVLDWGGPVVADQVSDPQSASNFTAALLADPRTAFSSPAIVRGLVAELLAAAGGDALLAAAAFTAASAATN
jgi:hypothetical protein